MYVWCIGIPVHGHRLPQKRNLHLPCPVAQQFLSFALFMALQRAIDEAMRWLLGKDRHTHPPTINNQTLLNCNQRARDPHFINISANIIILSLWLYKSRFDWIASQNGIIIMITDKATPPFKCPGKKDQWWWSLGEINGWSCNSG